MKRISLHLRSLCLALGLASMLVSPGCATLASDLTAFRSAVDVADMVIDAIDDFANSYFTAHPDPSKLAAIQAAEAQARAAAAAALSIANGIGDVQNAQVAQAFQSFEDAYSSLLALAQSIGVRAASPGAKVGAEPVPGGLVVPAPGDLRPAMVKAVAPAAVSLLRSPGDATPKTGPSALTGDITLASTWQMPAGLVSGELMPSSPCPVGMRDATPVFPGAVCVRDDMTWDGLMAMVRTQDRGYREAVSSWANAVFAAAEAPRGRFTYAGVNVGRLAAACDNACGRPGTGLVTPDGCSCWHEKPHVQRESRWVALAQ